jgi:MscS family membrane protein
VAHRRAAGIEAVIKLKEILDRTPPPRLDQVPDVGMLAADRQRKNEMYLRSTGPFRWRYPNSRIEIVEITEGDRQGEFLFSSSTVRQINDLYRRVRDLPYVELTGGQQSTHLWTDRSEGFYELVFANPGDLIPRLSILGGFVESLPDWFKTEYFGNTLWQWIALVLCVLAVALTVTTLLRALTVLAERLYPPLDSWLMVLAPILIMLIVLAMNYFVDESLRIDGGLRAGVRIGSQAIVIMMAMWAVVRFCKTIAETVIASPRVQERSLDANLFRIMARIAAFLIGGWIVVASVRDLGADLVPLLAGVGVGGLAIALAAQRTFANFIGTLILSANKPVKIGDFCRYGDQIGTVEHIGLLATRIRSLERTIVTVPNAEFSEMKLDNFAVRDRRLLRTTLQLRYETSPEQMRYILAELRTLLVRHPKVTPEPARVRFVGYGAYSKDVEVFAYLDCQDQNTFLGIQEDVLLRVEDIVNEAGSGFAFPSQTAYLSRDKGLDRERGGRVEARVQQWRTGGKLPFPEFEVERREKLRDTLDYPPEGSPDYVPPRASVDRATETGSADFSEEDFVDLASLVVKLQEPTQIADYLWSRLSTKTQKLLSNYSADVDRQAREALVQDLNVIIQGPSIHAIDRFSEVKQRQETLDLLKVNPEGEELARLNRLLLEDAFPKELQKPKSD